MNIYINQNLNCVTHAHFSVAATAPSIKEQEERSLQITNASQKKTYGKSIKKKDKKIAKLEKTLEKERQKRRKQKQQRHREQTSGKLNNENISEKNRDTGCARDDSSRMPSQFTDSTLTQRKHLIYTDAKEQKEKQIHDDLNKQLDEEEIEDLRLEPLNKQLDEEEIENLRLERLNKQLNEEEKFEKQQANTEKDVSFIESEFSRIVSLSSNESSSSVIDVDSDHQRPMLLHDFNRFNSQKESLSLQEELQQLEEGLRCLEESTPEVQSPLFEESKEELKKIEERAYRSGYLPRPQNMFVSGSSASQYRQYRCNN